MKYSFIVFFSVFILFSNCEHIAKDKLTHQSGSLEKLWTEENRKFLTMELIRTKKELILEINDLNDEQWNFKENNNRWSIAQIVEHLGVQDESYFREIFLVSKTPQSNKYFKIVKGKDQEFLNYAVDTTKGKTDWTLEPIGRFYSKSMAIKSFVRTRDNITRFVNESDLDLRRFFTFRKYLNNSGLSDAKLWDVRDLHQLLLTTISHTERHINQLKKVKTHPNYPVD